MRIRERGSACAPSPSREAVEVLGGFAALLFPAAGAAGRSYYFSSSHKTPAVVNLVMLRVFMTLFLNLCSWKG